MERYKITPKSKVTTIKLDAKLHWQINGISASPLSKYHCPKNNNKRNKNLTRCKVAFEKCTMEY